MIYSVYAIQSKLNGRIYVGLSSNVKNRVKDHNQKRVKSTKAFVPWKIIYVEKVGTRLDAREREKKLKSGVGREFLKTFTKAI